jgi:hypothetical protein
MERLAKWEGLEQKRVRGLVRNLVEKAPDEPAMQHLGNELLHALNAAVEKNIRVMEDAILRGNGYHNMLASKNFDLLIDLEEVVEMIRSLPSRDRN